MRQAPLWELYRNEQALRESDLAELLFSGYDVDTQRRIQGIYTVADAVNDALTHDPTSDVNAGNGQRCPGKGSHCARPGRPHRRLLTGDLLQGCLRGNRQR